MDIYVEGVGGLNVEAERAGDLVVMGPWEILYQKSSSKCDLGVQ